MLLRENYTKEHIVELREQTGADPSILERTVNRRLVDMFPHTPLFLESFPCTTDIHGSVSRHVETVCLMGKR